ncbi:MAG: undecaprenyl-diphosphate phosphatase [Nitriliruptor sp.]|uniref:undecaprenyl-diphosphate phosphatase n=1 Tax=Nitriliruptor sp. TaxID=2448056 RepID=UPI00349FE3A3
MFLILQAIVLGLLQGLTEFLPVSSSGHLQGVPYLLGWESGSLTFDVMVHAGTLVAVIAYFREDLWWLATRSIGIGAVDGAEQRRARRVVMLLAVGTLPAAVAGVAFESTFEAAFNSPRAVSLFLYITAALLVVAERIRRKRAAATIGKPVADLVGSEGQLDPGRREDTVTLRDAAVIGAAQAFAIFPGVSRAGSTIAAGMLLGLSRAAAARFSFLLSVPIIVGVTIAKLPDLGTAEPGTLPFGSVEIAAGVIAAAASGYWAIRFLLRLVQTDDLIGFARYVAVFATLLLAGTFMIG